MRCLVVHPGIRGDRGPSALDWAILDGESAWGVTVLEANARDGRRRRLGEREVPDARRRPSRSLYRNEVTRGGGRGCWPRSSRIARGERATPLAQLGAAARGTRAAADAPGRPGDRLDADDTASVLRKIRAADGLPGRATTSCGPATCASSTRIPRTTRRCAAPPSAPAPCSRSATARSCGPRVDGAVWITHLRASAGDGPALQAARGHGAGRAAAPACRRRRSRRDAPVAHRTWRPIDYEERGRGRLPALPLLQRRHGHRAVRARCAPRTRRRSARPTRVIVLMGGPDFWSNGIHLNLIEAAEHPAEESWRNINAMDDLVREIIATTGAAHDRRAAGQRRRRRRVPGARRRPRLRARRRASSTRTTRAWATSTAPSTGPTCCRAAWVPTARWR